MEKQDPVRLGVIVNGGPESAAAERVRQLLAGLASSFEVRLFYRQGGRARSLVAFIRNLLVYRPQLIYLVDTALPGALATLLGWLVLRRRVVVDTGDLGYELARNTGLAKGWQLGLVWLVEKAILRAAHRIIVRGSYHKKLLDRNLVAAGRSSKVVFLPDGVDCNRFYPPKPAEAAPLADLRRQLGLTDCFVMGTVGSSVWSEKLQMAYGWDVVEALDFLRDLDIKALIIARGSGVTYLRQRAAELGVSEQLCLVEGVPHEQLATYLHLMDVAISTQTNNAVGQVRTTGKLPQYMATGRFILASEVGEASRVLKPYKMLLPYHSAAKDVSYPRRLAGRVRELYINRAELVEAAQLPAIARQQFDYAVLRAEFSDLITKLA